MCEYLALIDALLVTLQESPVFAMTIPGKVQSYMAAGKPILTMLSGEGSRIIEEAKCGYVAKSSDYEQLANNIIAMSELKLNELVRLGGNAKRYAQTEFDRDTLIAQLEAWFVELDQQPKSLNSSQKSS